MAHNFLSSDALKLKFCRLLVCRAMFPKQKENSDLENYRNEYSKSKLFYFICTLFIVDNH